MLNLKADQPKPQFVMNFEQQHYQDFETVAAWLISQMGTNGWKFESRQLKSDKPAINKLMSSLRIENDDVAFQAKLTFPDILLNYYDLEPQLKPLFFFDPKKHFRVDSKNYDIVPIPLKP
jgi:hypothetical protein